MKLFWKCSPIFPESFLVFQRFQIVTPTKTNMTNGKTEPFEIIWKCITMYFLLFKIGWFSIASHCHVTCRFVNFPHGFLFNTSDRNDARKTSTLRLYTFNRFGGYDFAPLSLGGVRFFFRTIGESPTYGIRSAAWNALLFRSFRWFSCEI